MAYRVEIIDEDDGTGAFRMNENLVIAMASAVQGSGTITQVALLVGVLAWSVSEEILAPDESKLAMELIDCIGVPANMAELVQLAKED